MSRHTTVCLNVAEKPSVARSLASVFGHMEGSVDGGQRRGEGGANQVFTHDNVRFPNVYVQGQGQNIQGPSK